MEALILAGGHGTRLRHLLNNAPKALAIINNRPFLEYLIHFLQKNGVDKFIFSLGHLHEQIEEFLSEKFPDLQVEKVFDPYPLGTGGAILNALSKSKEEDVVIVNADTYFDVNLLAFYAFHKASNSDCTIALKYLEKFDRYGSVKLEQGRITDFNEKVYLEKGLINAGFIFLKKSTFTHFFKEIAAFSFEKDFLQEKLAEIKVCGFESDGYFIDIGVPDDFYKANIDFAAYKFS